MALTSDQTVKAKAPSRWVSYIDHETGKELAKFKIRGVSYKSYRVALQRAYQILAEHGYKLETINDDSPLLNDLLAAAAARFLIEDWQNVFFVLEKGKDAVEVGYSPENAVKLLNPESTSGQELVAFIATNANLIQAQHDAEHEEILGK